jgi:hypothetical protein
MVNSVKVKSGTIRWMRGAAQLLELSAFSVRRSLTRKTPLSGRAEGLAQAHPERGNRNLPAEKRPRARRSMTFFRMFPARRRVGLRQAFGPTAKRKTAQFEFFAVRLGER